MIWKFLRKKNYKPKRKSKISFKKYLDILAKQKTLTVNEVKIRFYQEGTDDYTSLTDIAKKFNLKTGQIISNGLRTPAFAF